MVIVGLGWGRKRQAWNILWWQKVEKCSKNDRDKAKEDPGHYEGALTRQTCNNLTIKINQMFMDCNPLNKIKIQ